MWLSLCWTYTGLTIIMWWAWTHVCHQGSKHGWCVWMVESTGVGHFGWLMPLWKIMQRMQWRQDFFFCGLKITTYDFNIYISYCSFSNTNTFVWCRFSFKVIIVCIKGIIKILNVMVFHFINLVLMHIWIQNNQLKC